MHFISILNFQFSTGFERKKFREKLKASWKRQGLVHYYDMTHIIRLSRVILRTTIDHVTCSMVHWIGYPCARLISLPITRLFLDCESIPDQLTRHRLTPRVFQVQQNSVGTLPISNLRFSHVSHIASLYPLAIDRNVQGNASTNRSHHNSYEPY